MQLSVVVKRDGESMKQNKIALVVNGEGAHECFGFVLGWFVKLYRLVILC